MIAAKFRVIGLLLWMPTVLMADKSHIRFIMDEKAGTELQLEVLHSPLALVLDEIAHKTGIFIHHSALPEGLFSVTCAEITVTEILECLLDKKADFIVRYSMSKGLLKKMPEEIWVLGSHFAVAEGISKGRLTTETTVTGKPVTKLQDVVQSGSDEISKLLNMAKAKNPALRMDAIAGLAVKGSANDSTIRKALTDALSDKDAQIREQAVSSLAHREGDKAVEELQLALQDSDSSVRLMVVDNAGENEALLQQALADSDETVRTLAAMKLDELSKVGSNQ